MWRSVLLTLILFTCSSQLFPTTGNFQPYADLASPNFQKVLAFIKQMHPQVSTYQVASVQRQLVSGFNYIVSLHDNLTGCEAKTKVYVNIAGVQTIMDFNQTCPPVSKFPIPISDPISPIIQDNPQIFAGGYSVNQNPSGSMFQKALGQALQQNPQFSRNELILTQTQVVAGMNWRFTFRDSKGVETKVVVIYVPLGGGIQPASPTASPTPSTPSDNATATSHETDPPLLGGYFYSTDQTQYQDALTAIYAKYPSYKSYDIAWVQIQVVAGTNYLIKLKQDSLNHIQESTFKVSIDLLGNAKVAQVNWINVQNFTTDDIAKVTKDSLAQHPQIIDYVLTSVENIWPNGQGLKLKFSNGNQSATVYSYSANGKVNNYLFQ